VANNMMDYSIFIYLILTAVTVGLAYFVNLPLARASRTENMGKFHTRQQCFNSVLVCSIFFLLFAVSACRIAVGNDYWVYRSDFLLIQQNRHVSFEPGFVLVVKLLQSMLNYDQYLPIFGFFSFFTVLFFVRGLYDQSEQFCYSLYLLLTAGYYFSSLNSVRYYLVLSIALFAAKYVIENDWLKFILWIAVAACFHKSVLIVIPLYFLASRNWKKKHMVLLALGCASLVLFQDFYRKIIFYFYPFYEGSMFDTGETSLTNIARCGAVLIFSLIYYKKAIQNDVKNRFYFYCNLGALVLYVFGSFIPEISRIGYYLNVTNIFLIPGILTKIEDAKQRRFWTVMIALAFLAYFALFLRSCYSTDVRILPYRNWIFQ